MGLFDRLRGAQAAGNPAALVGVWQLVRSDSLEHQDAALEIRDDGRMTYSIRAGATWQVIQLTYRVDGDTLVSNQPSAPREERTRFVIERDGTLMLALGGEQSPFRRSEKRAPARGGRVALTGSVGCNNKMQLTRSGHSRGRPSQRILGLAGR